MKPKVILDTNFPGLKMVKKGKVRDIYDLGEFYLIVSTDRLSAFDVIMSRGIPFKGKVLTKISEIWFKFTKSIISNHLISTDVNQFPVQCREYYDDLEGRSMLVKKAEVIPIECIVRGYISGSGWNDYKNTGCISGIKLPPNLMESEKLQEPIFTPSTKADIGLHDENISFEEAERITNKDILSRIKEASLAIYRKASDFALKKGIIIADTKMEFGVYKNEIILVDELLTPDSSRFWPVETYQKGKSPESYDKQYIRDYLLSIKFNKQPPAPELPDKVIDRTIQKYLEVLYKLTGESINVE